MEIFWLSKVLCVDFEMFMFGAEQWSGWLGAKVRKKGMMRKFFILKEKKNNIRTLNDNLKVKWPAGKGVCPWF